MKILGIVFIRRRKERMASTGEEGMVAADEIFVAGVGWRISMVAADEFFAPGVGGRRSEPGGGGCFFLYSET